MVKKDNFWILSQRRYPKIRISRGKVVEGSHVWPLKLGRAINFVESQRTHQSRRWGIAENSCSTIFDRKPQLVSQASQLRKESQLYYWFRIVSKKVPLGPNKVAEVNAINARLKEL